MSTAIPSAPSPVASTLPTSASPLAIFPACGTVTESLDQPQIDTTDEERSTFWRDFLYSSPTWGISMLVHMALVLGLAMYTTVEVLKDGGSALTATVVDAPEALEQIDDVIKFEEVEVDPKTVENPNPTDSQMVSADSSLSPEKLDSNSQGELPAIADFGDAGSGLTTDFGEMKIDKPGSGTSASFFGVPAKGKKFCFVVDNSGSMKGDKFKNALYELGAAIDKLTPAQSYYIIFFSHQPFPLYYPSPAQAHVPATPKNKQLTAQWLSTIEFGKATKGKESMEMALSLQPDVIYLLGDGAFTDTTAKDLLAREIIRTKIHTIGFDMKAGSRQAKDFEAIANKFYGTYREVSAKPIK
jgi:hypothetical protein